MHRRNHMLTSNSFRAQDVHIHEDLLSTMPSALSRNPQEKAWDRTPKGERGPARLQGLYPLSSRLYPSQRHRLSKVSGARDCMHWKD